MGRRNHFQVGYNNDCLFVGQRIQWNVANGELQEITFDKHLKDATPLTPQMQTAHEVS